MYRIALEMLTADRARFIGIILGIASAALLITQQASIFFGLLSRAHAAIDDIPQADLWVMDPSVEVIDLEGSRGMSATALGRVRGVSGVKWAVPHFRIPTLCTLGGGARRSCVIVGIDTDTFLGAAPEILQGSWADLRRADAVIVEEDGAKKLWRPGPNGERVPLAVGDTIEVNDRRARVVGICRTRRPVFFAPTLYTLAERARLWTPALRKDTSYILAGVRAGADRARVAEEIRLATGLKAFTREEFGKSSSVFFARNTGIPINFGIAVGLGFAVGTAVAGLLFVQFVRDNLRYLGTLKAMGASMGLLARMTLVQAGTVGVIGYGLGVGFAALVGQLAGHGKGALAWYMPPMLLVVTAAAVLLICGVASLLALRRIAALEPAAVFRG
jgi:putative ABC transport system permease protein